MRCVRALGFVWGFFLFHGFAFGNCYDAVLGAVLRSQSYFEYSDLGRRTQTQEAVELKSFGTEIPISMGFEKEGLDYRDIAHWFPHVNKKIFQERLTARLELEKGKEVRPTLRNWLLQWMDQYRPREFHKRLLPKHLQKLKGQGFEEAQAVLDFLIGLENPFDGINLSGRALLFEQSHLTFDHLVAGLHAPKFLTVGDDLGSYEVKTSRGDSDLTRYRESVQIVEEKLDGKVGHQHLVHAWPESIALREQIGPRYVELLDSTSWYFFWRQIRRDPNLVESIAFHPYFGVYTRNNLENIHSAYLRNDPEIFKKSRQKYRMVGMRTVPGAEHIPEQKGKWLPDWELRSNNKSLDRTAVIDMLITRFSKGEYADLRDFREYEFDPSTNLQDLARGLLGPKELQTLIEFEQAFKPLEHNEHASADNRLRNRLIAPLLPWAERLSIPVKADLLREAQSAYALELARIGSRYLKESKKLKAAKLQELKEETIVEIEEILAQFADQVRLDQDFERYLRVKPQSYPKIQIPVRPGDLDVNQVNLGVEYSFRFPTKPKNAEEAELMLRKVAESLQAVHGGGRITQSDTQGHGHNLSIKFQYEDPSGQIWRVEWDGVQRYYRNGKPYWAHGGHIEIPTPKFAPQTVSDVEKLFQATANVGVFPIRRAGGAHMNIDLAPIRDLDPVEGARKLKNLISFFETHREMIQFLWQSPTRTRVAEAVQYDREFIRSLNEFEGGVEELGALLYRGGYLNNRMYRKPGYTQMNLTGLMDGEVPDLYKKSIDIKNQERPWFPSFKSSKDRIEFRLFDAPEDLYLAALQIKYTRALLNRTWNAADPILLKRPESAKDRVELWRGDAAKFYEEAEAHLRDLGLNPEEFTPLLRNSFDAYQRDRESGAAESRSKRPSEKPYLNFIRKIIFPWLKE